MFDAFRSTYQKRCLLYFLLSRAAPSCITVFIVDGTLALPWERRTSASMPRWSYVGETATAWLFPYSVVSDLKVVFNGIGSALFFPKGMKIFTSSSLQFVLRQLYTIIFIPLRVQLQLSNVVIPSSSLMEHWLCHESGEPVRWCRVDRMYVKSQQLNIYLFRWKWP